jgi:hypothetical protein
MISLVISALLCIMMIQLFLFTKQCFITQQGLARIQENGLAIDHILGRAIRNSGNMGCQKLMKHRMVKWHHSIDPVAYGLDKQAPMMGGDPTDAPTRAIPNSDILWILGSSKNYPLRHGIPQETKVDFIINQAKIKPGSIGVLADCRHADFFRVSPKPDQQKLTLSQAYPPHSTFSIFSSTLYYVGNTNRKNANQEPIYALYSTDLNGRTLELVEGIENFELLFGCKKGINITYHRSIEIADWQQVVSVRLIALLTTIESSSVKPVRWMYEWPLTTSN